MTTRDDADRRFLDAAPLDFLSLDGRGMDRSGARAVRQYGSVAERPRNEDDAHGDGYQLLFTVIYGGIATGTALVASATSGWPSWVFRLIAAIFSAITAWMLLRWGIALSLRIAVRVVERKEGRKGG